MGTRSKQPARIYWTGIRYVDGVFISDYTRVGTKASVEDRLSQRFNWERKRTLVCPYKRRRKRR